MVNPRKEDEILVTKPRTINNAKIDSDKAAIKPKKIGNKSYPIISAKTPPSQFHRFEPAVNLP